MAARALIARLQICDLGPVVTVSVLILFDVSVLGRFPRGGGLPLAARSLIARLQICDLGPVATLSVLILFDVSVLGRFTVHAFLHVGLLGLLFVSFWAEG